MRIAVCVKHVRASGAAMDLERGVMIRAHGGTINLYDLHAVEAALRAAKSLGAETIAIAMGPKGAEEALRAALAMGILRGALLCDAAFAGADVLATAHTLAQGLLALGGFDLIFCGQQTTDGDTAQLPFSLAAQFGARAAGWVKRVEAVEQGAITVLQELSEGTQRLRCPFPAVVAVGREANEPRMPSAAGQLRARHAEIVRLSLADLPDSDPAHHGLAASPTRVLRAYRTADSAKAEPLRLPAREAALRVLAELEAQA